MKKHILLFFLIFVALFVVIITYLAMLREGHPSLPSKELKNESLHDQKTPTIQKTVVTITDSGMDMTRVTSSSTVWHGTNGEDNLIEMKVEGKITDVRLVRLSFDENTSNLVEEGTVASTSELTNNTLYIKTVTPEGAPFERLTWKSESGKEYLYNISYNGRDDSNATVFTLE